MKVLVTGGTGFVGEAISNHLKLNGYDVTIAGRNVENTKFECFRYDSLNSNVDWSVALKNCSYVIHLAAQSHAKVSKDLTREALEELAEVNTAATINLAKQANKLGVVKFIFLSSIGVNGKSSGLKPFVDYDEPNPHNSYAWSKYLAEVGLERICRQGQMKFVILRCPLIYGSSAKGHSSVC